MIFEEKTIKSDRIYEGSILNLRRDKVTVLHGTSYRDKRAPAERRMPARRGLGQRLQV